VDYVKRLYIYINMKLDFTNHSLYLSLCAKGRGKKSESKQILYLYIYKYNHNKVRISLCARVREPSVLSLNYLT
jgi:hypothetical protein